MPVCKKCEQQWSWIQTLKKSSVTLSVGMVCPYCKEKQYISAYSRKRNSLSVLIIMMPFLIRIPFNLPISTTVIFALTIGLIVIGISPFFIKLSNEDEPLF